LTPETSIQWLESHPALVLYLGLLVLGSLIAFVVLLRQLVKENRIRAVRISGWKIPGSDFGLLLCCLVAWFGLSGSIVFGLWKMVVDAEAEPGLTASLFTGFLLQGGLLLIFLFFHTQFRRVEDPPLSPRILSNGRAMAWGFYFFLASLPFIYSVNLFWNLFIEALRMTGIEIDLPLQDAVLLFQEAQHPAQWLGLVFLAVVVAPVVEEFIFRGGVYRFCKGRMRLTFAMILSSLLFSAFHWNIQSFPGLAAVGVALCFAYEQTGNLRVPIYFHACFNLNSVIWIFLLPEGVLPS